MSLIFSPLDKLDKGAISLIAPLMPPIFSPFDKLLDKSATSLLAPKKHLESGCFGDWLVMIFQGF